MKFIGIDLAWSDNNTSGFAAIEGNRKRGSLIYSGIVDSDRDIIDRTNDLVKESNALIAIDAPLIVPNMTGRRKAEELVGNLFRKYNAGAHPSNRERLSSWTGSIRGEEISKLLRKNGFSHDPYLKRFEKSRKFFEVYPHPSMVVLFNLEHILQYKAKQNRDYKTRYNAFKDYQSCLKGLKNAGPSLNIPKGIAARKIEALKGKELKRYEDTLDAIFCAYIAYYCWANPNKCAVLGDMQKGYIITPVTSKIQKELEQQKGKQS